MHLYNTLTRKIEEFIPNEEGKASVYTCGPTVYHYAHIGNMRSYIHEDILIKALEYNGYDVKRVMNITDVGHLTSDADSGDDKMVESAKKEHKTVMDIAQFYTDAFFTDFNAVNNKMPDIISPATDNIVEYIIIIEKLLETGYAYKANGNVYFDTSKLKNYYVLSNHQEDNLIVGARDDVTEDIDKKNKTDFVLWFTKSKFENQDLKWDSPFGVGYPGWHIECSAISIKYLGQHLDIHCGGVDNAFPHHTNEIAQSESFLGHKWCNYWFHVEHLNDADGKMSKSKGATLSVAVLKEKGYTPLAFRYMCLNSHYRKQLVFSFEGLDSATIAYKKLKTKVLSLKSDGLVDTTQFDRYNKEFIECINDDLNTANAVTLLYELLKNDIINDITKKELVNNFDKVLSLDLLKEEETNNHKNHDKILELIDKRKEAKNNKDFELADKIRKEIEDMGVTLVDTREGTTYKIKE